jgi:pimeloyl-ACP methyl ester carboxylesterase
MVHELLVEPPFMTNTLVQQAWQRFYQQAQRGVIHTGRYPMRYFVWGHGRPLLFIHGMADAPEAFVVVIDQLRQNYRCIAYALPNGWNDGAHLPSYRWPDYLEDLDTLLRHLGEKTVTVVGSSFGSLVTLYALAVLPQRCLAGVLQNGFAYRPLRWWENILVRWGRCFPGWFADWPYCYDTVMHWWEPTVDAEVPALLRQLHRYHGSHTPIFTAAWRGWIIGRTDFRPLLPTIRQPVLLITGDRDRLVHERCWQDLQRLLPHSQRIHIPGCGHYPQYTHPRQMAQALRTFLDTRAHDDSDQGSALTNHRGT